MSVPATPGRGNEQPVTGSPRVTLAAYGDYDSAQRAVDYLSDHHFPVDHLAIVGTDLRLVEQVLTRMTMPRAALAGAGTGAWIGLLIGLLFGLFAVADWWLVVLAGLVLGALWGAIFGAIAHGVTGGRRDFTSARRIEADRYAVTVDADHAQQARDLLLTAG